MKPLILILALILSACVPTVTPTPTTIPPTITPSATPPQSPWITPTPPTSPLITPTPFVSPLAVPAAIPTSLQCGDFECGFTARENSVTVANNWNYWKLNAPPCKPGSAGCPFPCPLNCANCGAGDQGCFWAVPEFAAAYKPDYNPPRAHGGLWGQKFFVYGREGTGGLYQQIQITTRALLTFTTWFEAWQCMDGDHCSLQSVKVGGSPQDPPPDPDRALFLMKEWGCGTSLEGPEYQRCKLWAASDRPYKMRLKVGIDPTGGTNATAPSVIWGKEIESFDYWSQAIVTATKTSPGTVTVFTHCAPTFDYARISNDCYIDDAALQVKSLLGYTVYAPMVANGK